MSSLIPANPGLENRKLQSCLQGEEGKVLWCPGLVEGLILVDPN